MNPFIEKYFDILMDYSSDQINILIFKTQPVIGDFKFPLNAFTADKISMDLIIELICMCSGRG